ncbi:MAG: hypothetical protein RLZ25_1994 [Pseudomonadota bacterium]|jgi:hypothetical protein
MKTFMGFLFSIYIDSLNRDRHHFVRTDADITQFFIHRG